MVCGWHAEGMGGRGPFEPEQAYWYSSADRMAQIDRLRRACERIADLLDVHDPTDAAGYRRVVAAIDGVGVRRVAASFDELGSRSGARQLHADLAASIPPGPEWMYPKATSQGPLQPWEVALTRLRSEVNTVLLELRSAATYDRPPGVEP